MEEPESLLNQGLLVILKRKNTDRQPIIHTLGNISGILGYPANEMKEESFSFFDIVAEKDRERVRKAIHMHLENGSTQFTHAPYHINKANGNKIIVNDSTLFQKDEQGGVTHIVSYIIDISGAKQIDPSHDAADKSTYFNANVQPKDDILKVKRRNNALLDALPDMMFLLSEDGRIVNYNLFSREAKGKGLQLSRKTKLSSSEAIVTTDKARLTSILSNLVKNAIKYTSKEITNEKTESLVAGKCGDAR